ncbi:hypothetical protein I307_00263 [Cryptococcus deuterogattii 99/473]|uniref:Uncharacterized protein n=1 Tax=Cryptococcus deuterogattii Ram5 TaxID=1296110 RepID=A0A0D0TC76_9TREE|nr:hypothetical protein I309_01054 [Cryptococcus deuterogattii LA55]KIR37228.1 hypothetical protein I352_00541 [Cryptococcus deuterogattii MMRL2647]KIR43697.1 hypothetical protein I313_00540 [Cryptococcus deuterogattii Ram5]KIR75030.1 hypothetical protein I310_01305 [Cryptococcus deuterogattii CA1014]KIR92699.1 hypothetical protein I304_03277 [Cryptococcus deuterogattii CBS 10090]KIR98021.1 hypothetical protein L804_04480 [Cryptococcus deuterogattii 2001/935-1]KIY60461.1 hypothetical protein 
MGHHSPFLAPRCSPLSPDGQVEARYASLAVLCPSNAFYKACTPHLPQGYCQWYHLGRVCHVCHL